MGRTLDDIIASLAPARRRRIGARYRVLKDEVESLGALRRLAGKLELPLVPAGAGRGLALAALGQGNFVCREACAEAPPVRQKSKPRLKGVSPGGDPQAAGSITALTDKPIAAHEFEARKYDWIPSPGNRAHAIPNSADCFSAPYSATSAHELWTPARWPG